MSIRKGYLWITIKLNLIQLNKLAFKGFSQFPSTKDDNEVEPTSVVYSYRKIYSF